MIYEGSWDTEAWSMAAENYITGINYILKYIK